MFGFGEEEVVSLAGILNSSRFHDDRHAAGKKSWNFFLLNHLDHVDMI